MGRLENYQYVFCVFLLCFLVSCGVKPDKEIIFDNNRTLENQSIHPFYIETDNGLILNFKIGASGKIASFAFGKDFNLVSNQVVNDDDTSYSPCIFIQHQLYATNPNYVDCTHLKRIDANKGGFALSDSLLDIKQILAIPRSYERFTLLGFFNNECFMTNRDSIFCLKEDAIIWKAHYDKLMHANVSEKGLLL